MPATAEGFQVDVSLDPAASFLSVSACSSTSKESSLVVNAWLGLARHFQAPVYGSYTFTVTGSGDPRAGGLVRAKPSTNPTTVTGTGIVDWEISYPQLGQSRCLGDAIDSIDVKGSWTTGNNTPSYATTSVFENGAFAQNAATANAADALLFLESNVPEPGLPTDPASCIGKLASADGFSPYGDVATAPSGDVLLVNNDRLVRVESLVDNPITVPLANGNGAQTTASPSADPAWRVTLNDGDYLVNYGPSAVGLRSGAGDLLAILAVASPTDYVDLRADERTGLVTMGAHQGDLVDSVPLALIVLATANPHDVSVCGTSPRTTETRLYPQPPDGPDYYDDPNQPEDNTARRRRTASCGTDSVFNTPDQANPRTVFAVVEWDCRDGTREKITGYFARAELERYIDGGQVNYWSTRDRQTRRGAKAERFEIPTLFDDCVPRKRYRSLTRMNFSTDVRGQLPDSPLYISNEYRQGSTC